MNSDPPHNVGPPSESHSPLVVRPLHRFRPELELREVSDGKTPVAGSVRTMTVVPRRSIPVGADGLETSEVAGADAEPGGWLAIVRRRAFGRPLATAAQAQERLTKIKALAVFSSDALSSVAYASEEILLVLAAAGAAALSGVLPISVAIVILLTIVALSYRQTIHAYPSGGGSYIVARDNLGNLPGLTAGGALMIDYVLTVAVSISAGMAAVTSAVAALRPYTLELALIALVFMVVVNLRGLRESGTIFAAPTYLFIGSIFLLIGTGVIRALFGGAAGHNLLAGAPAEQAVQASQTLTIFLILRAFASGCTAMTGVEAISNGVPAFKPPESENAGRTLVAMAAILGAMFLGIGVLSHHFGLVPNDRETILSQLGDRVFLGGPLYYLLQAATFAILVLAANTSFADFPRLSSIMARDGFLPHQFTFRGDRLAFTNGIAVLAVLAGALLIVFKADTDRLIPLYAVGVFLSFTLSQAGMVRHWLRQRGPNWRRSLVINASGALATGVVTVIIAATKFVHGAWVVVVLIPCLVTLFFSIYRHYRRAEAQLRLPTEPTSRPQLQTGKVVVPVGGVNRATLDALAYARALSEDITAVHVTDDPASAANFQEEWHRWGLGVPLLILETPYRSFLDPLLAYVDAFDAEVPGLLVTVVLSEVVPEHWWQNVLHNQKALRLQLSLRSRPNTVVTEVPYQLGR